MGSFKRWCRVRPAAQVTDPETHYSCPGVKPGNQVHQVHHVHHVHRIVLVTAHGYHHPFFIRLHPIPEPNPAPAPAGEGVFREQAKARQGMRTDLKPESNIKEILPEGGQSRDAIASIAGVSGRTIDKVKAIQVDAIPEVREMARSGGISRSSLLSHLWRPDKEKPPARTLGAAEPRLRH